MEAAAAANINHHQLARGSKREMAAMIAEAACAGKAKQQARQAQWIRR